MELFGTFFTSCRLSSSMFFPAKSGVVSLSLLCNNNHPQKKNYSSINLLPGSNLNVDAGI